MKVSSLCDIVGAERKGHLSFRDFFKEQIPGNCISAIDHVIVIITEDERQRHADLFDGNGMHSLETPNKVLLVVPDSYRNNPEAMAERLRNYGNFQIRKPAAA